MRRVVDVLLVLALLLASGALFFILGDRKGADWFKSSIPTASNPPTQAPTQAPTAQTVRVLTLVRTLTATPTEHLTATHTTTSTPTQPPSFTPTLTTSLATATAGVLQPETDAEINEGIQIGNQIVLAIEAHRQAEDRYPSDLRELIPSRLPEIPVTGTGQDYLYRLFDETSPMAAEIYWLAFKVTSREHTTCTYLRRLDYWDCNSASP
jgi:hypothetical protein